MTHPDQTTERYDYDAEDQLIAYVDAKGQVTRYRYNGHGLPVERIDAKGQTLQYRYDKALRLVELINGNGESYRFTYDAESRLASETGFDGKTTTYTYDDAGELIGSACADQTHSFVRDALGQLLAKTGPLGHERYAYDALGRLTAVANAHAEYRYGYDALGQLVEERFAYTLPPDTAPSPATPEQPAEPTAAFVLTHAYDPLGNRLRTTLPNGRTIDTLRYGSGHWHGTLWQGQSLVDLERDSLHRETGRQFGRGAERLSAQRAYDPQSRLIAFSLNRGTQRLHERRYTYDEVGNLTAINDAQRGRSTYRYDPLGQLLSAVQPTLSETFAFDPAGNLLDTAAAATTHFNREAGAANEAFSTPPTADQPSPGTTVPRLPRVTHNLLRQYLGTSYEYDVQGNTVLKREVAVAHGAGANEAATLAFAYDADNRLIEARRTWPQTRERAHYTYDAFGRRIAKCVTEEMLATGETLRADTTLFVWDGDVLAQEIQPDRTITYLYEPDSFVPLAQIESAQGRAAYAPERVHLAHPAQWELPTPTDEAAAHQSAQSEHAHQADWQTRLAQAEGAAPTDTIRYYHCDHLGTPLELLDESGKPVWAARYKTWGRIQRYDTREVEQPLRFQGQYEDAETGLHYNRHRYYDPDAARFITQDPIGLLGGINVYQYGPNPTGWVDPLGLTKKKGGCDPCCPKLIVLNPKDVNFAQRTVNPGFDTPLGKIAMDKAIEMGAGQVAAFPPISVINVKGQWVARDGNSRLLIAQKTKAKGIAAMDESSCVEKRKDLASRLRNNKLPAQGTSRHPSR